MGTWSLLALLTAARAQGGETITLRADEWCPYNCAPGSPEPGLLIEIAQAALEPAGYRIDYQTMNWARAISETRSGRWDGVVGASHADAPDFVFPDEPQGKGTLCFFTAPKSQWRWDGIASLEKISLGVARDYSYGEPIDSYLHRRADSRARVEVASGDSPLETNIRKVTAGRIQVLIENVHVVSWFLKGKSSSPKLRNAGCIPGDDVHIAFSPKHPEAEKLAALVSATMVSLRNNGRLKTLLTKYGVADEQLWSHGKAHGSLESGRRER